MWVTLLGILATLVAIGYAVYKYYGGNDDYWTKLGVPSLKSGELATFWERITLKVSFLEYDALMYNRFKDQKLFGYVELREPGLYIRDLDLMKQILVKDFDHFVDRRKISFDKDDEIIAKMLIQRRGKEWKDLRSVMSPTFTTGKIKRMFTYFNGCADQFANHLKKRGETGDSVDFQDEFGKFTVSAIASIVFGLQPDVFENENSLFMKMVKRMQSISYIRILQILLLMVVPKIAKALKLSFSDKPSMDFFSSVIRENIKQRRVEGVEKRQDFLQMMLEAQAGQSKVDEKELDSFEKDALLKEATGTGKKDLAVVLDDDTIVAQALLFFSAGFDTVQTALTFAAYELAVNQDVQERLADEVVPIMKKNNGALTYESVNEMQYLDMVVAETLRKNPPAVLTERECNTDYKIPDTDIIVKKGMRLLIPINSIHHDEKYYPDPEKFNPEHFSAENKAKRHPYAYLPFGQGPRNCIAMRFALTETKAAIAHLVYNFKIEPCEKTQIPMTRSPKSAKPEHCWLKFQPRKANATDN
ncbi:unnamed protein product [Allacma fusca]|uniref:Cytochrome P450 n=3 Tax=Allacma fusca TaxID=39272 RepID=A0A8J2PKA1_9HEXA|nr:unnamed protein product [Allacma fusca]